jgi:hypothetical protein
VNRRHRIVTSTLAIACDIAMVDSAIMMSDPSFDRLSHAANVFIQAIESLSDDLFLRSIDEWTPRDVAAHLTWWNRNMIVAGQSLQAGTPPSYYADAMNDYRNINARAIAEFHRGIGACC